MEFGRCNALDADAVTARLPLTVCIGEEQKLKAQNMSEAQKIIESTNVEDGTATQTDADTVLCVGCRVRLTRFDAEEGFPVVNTGVVSFDWEEKYYRKQIDVKLDNGEIVSMIPKWSVEVIGNHV